jgi:hypothetical protein
MARTMFGAAIDYDRVMIRRRCWWWFQPRRVSMAPTGHLHFHPLSDHYCEDFSQAQPRLQAHFIHEMTHVWQAQTRGRWYLPLFGPFQRRYSYRLEPGKPLTAYGIEQQAEIVEHAFMLRMGWMVEGVTDPAAHFSLIDF